MREAPRSESQEVSSAGSTGTIRLLAVLLILATLGAYLNSLPAPFIFDDENWILNHRPIQNLPDDLRKLGITNRPLMHLSVAVNYGLGELDVRGYHIFNLVVHTMAGLLLFGITRRTIRLSDTRSAGRLPADSLAFAVALLWLVHPLQTQSVTYIIQRCESMMGMFFLLCLYSLIRGSQSKHGQRWYVLCIAACVLGLGCKEVMVAAPPVALLYDRVFLSQSWRELFQRRGWVHGLLFGSALGLVVLMLPMILGGAEGAAGFGYQKVSPLMYLRSQPGVILHYLRLVFWPRPLCLDYLWPPAKSAAEIVPPAAAITGLLIVSLAALRRWPWLGFLGCFFFLVLAPTSSVMPVADLAFEHRMYLPLAAVVVLVVLATYQMTQQGLKDPQARRLARVGALALTATALAALTWQRNADYLDPVRIWSKVLEVSPQNHRAHNALADLYMQRGDHVRERYHHEQAIVCKPDFERLYFTFAAFFVRQDDPEEALYYYRRALELKPDYVEALVNCGALLGKRQEWDEAVAYYRRALNLKPDDAAILRELAVALWRSGQTREAVAAYRRLLVLRPHLAGVKVHLAKILATAEDASVRNGPQALELTQEARRQIGEDNYRVFDALAAAYAELGRYDEACRAALNSIQLAKRQRETGVLPDLESRLELYRQRKASPEKPGSPNSSSDKPTDKNS